MIALLQDCRQAFTSLRKRPGFSAVVILTMAVGIGANVAFFGYLSALLWPTMQAPEPERLVWLRDSRPDRPAGGTSYPDWLDFRDQSQSFSQTAAWRFYGTSVVTETGTLYAWGHAVAGDYFELFGARPEFGRLLDASDDRAGAEPVVVLHHFFWRRHFASDPNIIGRQIDLDGRHPYTVVGITRRGFQAQGLTTGIYVPLATADWLPGQHQRTRRNSLAIARLAPGAHLESATAEITNLGSRLDKAHPEEEPRGLILQPIAELTDSDNDGLLLASKALMGAVLLLLLLACANIANLMLARTIARRRELAMHAALGADPWRLARRLLMESVVLSSVGGLAGLLLAAQIRRVIVRYLLQTVPIGFGEWAADVTILADSQSMTLFFVAACAATGLLFGALPALSIMRTDLARALKGDASGTSPGRWRARQSLVVVQVALSVLLMLGAGLLARSFWQAKQVDLGFDPDRLEVAALFVPTDRLGDEAEGKARYEQILASIRQLPGVRQASLADHVPLAGVNQSIRVKDQDGAGADFYYSAVATDYFATLGLPLLIGRAFDQRDQATSPRVAIVNQVAAARFWPGESPLGQILDVEDTPRAAGGQHEVIGVVADSRFLRPTDDIEPLAYLSYQQRFHRRMTLVARTSAPFEHPLRQLLSRSFPELAVIEVVPFENQLQRSVAEQRMNADLAGGFGLLGLLLAALGLYSVTSYNISHRSREIGIRMAVGARPGRIVRMVLGEIARLVMLGLGIGLALALVLTRLLTSLLFGIGTFDPPTLVLVPMALACVALLATLAPLRRAARIDPLRAIRTE